MSISRRGLLQGTAASALAPLGLTTGALAQEFPSREIRLICGFAAGSGADVIHRYFARQLQAVSGKTFIVENHVGAAGNLAHSVAAKARPDGHTVYLVGGNTLSSSMHLFKTPPIDPFKDFEYIGSVLKQGWFVAVDAKTPFMKLQDLTEHLRKKGAKASYSSSTVIGQVMGELYKINAGHQAVQVGYKTIGDSLNDLLSGNLDFMASDAAYTLGQEKAGRLRILGISTGERMKVLAHVPTMAEGGVPGIDLNVWWVTAVPAGTPKPIQATLKQWFDQVLAMKETETFLNNIATDVYTASPEQTFKELVAAEKIWADAIAKAKIEKQ